MQAATLATPKSTRLAIRPHGDVEHLEITLLSEAIHQAYGYDYREYAYASLSRRIRAFLQSEGLPSISALQERVLHDPGAMERLLLGITVNVTALFRDPEFFLAFRRKVVPWLRTYPFVRIWHAGCSTGEEVYSMAILLEEERLIDKCRIYATDLSESVLRRAREGIFSLDQLERYSANHFRAGGLRPFSEYYTAGYGSGILRSSLRDKVIFARHNLASEGSFNEFHVILCRNVLIYFKRSLQSRVHELFFRSLGRFGVLGLGDKESIQFTPHEKAFEQLEPGTKLYRRIG